ncbi:MAG: hypothetical protein ABIG40_00815 [Parcubacteria group bacterium]
MERKKLVFLDIDGILVSNKQDLKPELREALITAARSIIDIIAITGGPFAHVKSILLENCKKIFAEHGGYLHEKGNVTLCPRGDLNLMKEHFKVSGVEDGEVSTPLGKIIIEGPRKTGLTFLFGSNISHYPGIETTADFFQVYKEINEVINKEHLSLNITFGKQDGYTYIDVASTTKKDTVIGLYNSGELKGYQKVYILGDARNDLEAMMALLLWEESMGLSNVVVPVGFTNCTKEIQALAVSRGIFIQKHAVDEGGTAEFFHKLAKGEF